MKQCPICGAQSDDGAIFCNTCGSKFGTDANYQQGAGAQYQQNGGAQYQQNPGAQYQPAYAPQPQYNAWDHTAEFDAKDISDNKVIAMLVYLMGAVGIVIALLAAPTSPYASFHLRQALKFTVVEILMVLFSAILCWTIIVPIAAGIMAMVLFVIKIICFVQICQGQAKEPAIIRSLNFLK